jgi:arylsulfatase A-like enzyme
MSGKRLFGRTRLVVMVAVSLFVAASCVGRSAEPRKKPLTPHLRSAPNVLIFLTDDQRVEALSAMPKTLRWFRDKGVHYPYAFASTPLCCPFRASLFSGRYAHNHRVRLNKQSNLLDQDETLQGYLQDAGYFSGITGKFLNNWSITDVPRNFDRWAFFTPSPTERGYYDVEFNIDGEVRVVERYMTSFIEDMAIDMMSDFEEDDDRPWLLYVTPYAPHTPYTTLPQYAAEPVAAWDRNPAVREKGVFDKPRFVRQAGVPASEISSLRVAQLRSLMPVDDLVDRVLRRVRRLGEQRRTLAFFMSDGGYLWGEHGVVGKKLPYTPSVRIPFFARWPGRLPQGRRNDSLVMNIDVAPTVLEAAGVNRAAARDTDGTSLLGPGTRDRNRVLLEHWRDQGALSWPTWASLWTRKYQYVAYYGRDNRKVSYEEFYDLRKDPWQMHNLLHDLDPKNDPDPVWLERVRARLEKDRRCSADDCP